MSYEDDLRRFLERQDLRNKDLEQHERERQDEKNLKLLCRHYERSTQDVIKILHADSDFGINGAPSDVSDSDLIA